MQNVSTAELINFFNAAEVFVFPSKCEGFGIPPLEAAALETPVICSNSTAMEDFKFFEPFVFDPHSYEDFSEKINMFIRDGHKLDKTKIKSFIGKKYSWSSSAKIFNKEIFEKE